MTLNDALKTILAIFPNATIGEDADGQVVINTDMTLDRQSNMLPME